ncbi:MAG: glycosyltransferase family 4 protein [Gammaproteobacteria bacterium]
MKVLWFTNSVMPEVFELSQIKGHGSGPWMAALLSMLKRSTEVEKIVVVTETPNLPDMTIEAGKITYEVLHASKQRFYWQAKKGRVADYIKLIQRHNPDVIHIHGSEMGYGQICGAPEIARKTVISLQGILCLYERKINGGMTLYDRFKATETLDIFRGAGIFGQRRYYRKRAAIEKDIFTKCINYFGRTRWDYAFVKFQNGKANYYNAGEILREKFYQNIWNFDGIEKFTVIFTNISGPVKGVESIFEAVRILSSSYPKIKLKIASRVNPNRGYGKYLVEKARILGIEGNVEFLGYLSEPQIIENLLRSHVFVSCSYIDNSPNSLGEAQILGMPCIASYVGGVPSMINDGTDGLLVPVDEPYSLADAISQIFENPQTAQNLGAAAARVARQRHDPDTVLDQVLMGYKSMLAAPT